MPIGGREGGIEGWREEGGRRDGGMEGWREESALIPFKCCYSPPPISP